MAGYATVGTRAPTIGSLVKGPRGFPGRPGSVGLGVNVRDLSANPASVTDWGPVINAAYTAGVRRFLLPDASGDGSGTSYPFSTQLAFNSSAGVVLEGESGQMWTGDSFFNVEVRSRLVWMGTGTTPPITARISSGFTMRDLGFYYSSSSFTGKMIDLSGIAAMPHIYRCDIRGEDALYDSADILIDLKDCIVATVELCTLRGADKLIRGNNGAHSNANRIIGCVLGEAGTSQLFDIFDHFVIERCTCEVGETPAVIDGTDTGDITSIFSFKDNWVGDATGADRPMFKQRSNQYWYAEFSGNDINVPHGPVWELNGGGGIQIVNNPNVQVGDTTAPIIDLGDVDDGALAKYNVTITGNGWTRAEPDAVINRAGHENVNIWGNNRSARARELRTLSGHERLGFPTGEFAPTPVKGAAVPNATVTLAGNDLAGVINVSPGAGASAGEMATVTFVVPMESSPGSPFEVCLVQLTPSNEAAAEAVAYQVQDNSAEHWKFATVNTPVGDCNWNYRVIRL